MDRKPNLHVNAPVTLVTGDADLEFTLARACAAAASLLLADIPVAIWQTGSVLFESTGRDTVPKGDRGVIQVIQEFVTDVGKAWIAANENAKS